VAQGPSLQGQPRRQAPGGDHGHGQLDCAAAGDGNTRASGALALSQGRLSAYAFTVPSTDSQYMTLSLTDIFLTQCDDDAWCLNVITNLGRLSLTETLEPGETVDIRAWVDPKDPLQGVALEEALSVAIGKGRHRETCGLLRCIGITKPELEFADQHGVEALFWHLRRADIFPRTIIKRRSMDLS
jgi:hypothetical protein